MPPKNHTLSLPAGIAGSAEREVLIRLAHDFESAGDQALAWEGDNKAESQMPAPSVQ